ncbi:MAG TPA: zinc-ribbon domain-containing protein [bacterium]|nr:zinc-ribbon domain-containing protein [bacterium]HPI76955.1 zinc-ribbon domain-containing protein [bacterium]
MMEQGYRFCSECGAQNPAKNKFCAKCGACSVKPQKKAAAEEQSAQCPNCGNLNSTGARFCPACSAPLNPDYDVSNDGDYVHIRIHLKQIDFENSRELSTLTKKIDDPYVIVDMSEIEWMDSSGIGAIVTVVHRFTRNQQQVKFVGIQNKVMTSIKALRADNIIDYYETLNEALVSWGLPPI